MYFYAVASLSGVVEAILDEAMRVEDDQML
jgi:hypothetical protein